MDIKPLLFGVFILQLEQSIDGRSLLRSRPLYLRFHYAYLCDDIPSDVYVENATVRYDGTKTIFNGFGGLKRPVKVIEKTAFIIRRCHDAAEDQNCEYFQTWRFGKESCILAEQKHMMWTSLMGAFEPRFKCPLQKGDYRLNNASLDTKMLQDTMSGIPLEKSFWRLRLEMSDYKMIVCVNFGVQYLRGK